MSFASSILGSQQGSSTNGSFLKRAVNNDEIALSALLMNSNLPLPTEDLRAKLADALVTSPPSPSSSPTASSTVKPARTTVNEMTLRAKLAEDVTLPTLILTLLSDPGFLPILSWLPHGKIWKIHDAKAFEQLLLPVFFEKMVYPHTMGAFVETLKEWGFELLQVEANGMAFFSEFFTRHKPLLSLCMTRMPKEDESTPSFRALLHQQKAAQVKLAGDLLRLLENDVPIDLETASSLLNTKPSPMAPLPPPVMGRSLLHNHSGLLPPSLKAPPPPPLEMSLPTSENVDVFLKEQSLRRQIAETEAQIHAATLVAQHEEQTRTKAFQAAALTQPPPQPRLEDELAVARLLVAQKIGATPKTEEEVPNRSLKAAEESTPTASAHAPKEGSLIELLRAKDRTPESPFHKKAVLEQDQPKMVPKKRKGRKKWLPPLGPPATAPPSVSAGKESPRTKPAATKTLEATKTS